MSQNAITVESLWKRYGLPFRPALRRGLAALRGRPLPREALGTWALRELSFEVQMGETLGIIGRNGAGKSTLLKVLAGVSQATYGRATVRGRIFPMIELNAGLHMELTGRENARLLAAIMGLTPDETRHILPDIEDFCELGEWFEQPVRKYSSGMLSRLGFAVAVNVDADILLVDEVLAVGDLTFQRKCFDRIETLRNAGKTVVLVSHNVRQIERLCDRVLLLEGGQIKAQGAPYSVIADYYSAANTKIIEHYTQEGERVALLQEIAPNLGVSLDEIRLYDAQGQAAQTFATGDDLYIHIHYTAEQTFHTPTIALGLMTVDSLPVASMRYRLPTILEAGAGVFVCHIPRLYLLNGVYMVQCKILGVNGATLGGGYGLASFNVRTPEHIAAQSPQGLVFLQAEWEQPALAKVSNNAQIFS
jgi:ABC-type polysaccharide/polyol phosphate transport system ATPase subunit